MPQGGLEVVSGLGLLQRLNSVLQLEDVVLEELQLGEDEGAAGVDASSDAWELPVGGSSMVVEGE